MQVVVHVIDEADSTRKKACFVAKVHFCFVFCKDLTFPKLTFVFKLLSCFLFSFAG